jgi:hypothetical protein
VTVSAWVAEDGRPQLVAEPALTLAAAKASVPEDGDTCRPLGTEATCQCTMVASPPADAAPSWTDAGCPAMSEVAPLGDENPTAGSSPDPNEGGLSAGDEAHAGSGEFDRV